MFVTFTTDVKIRQCHVNMIFLLRELTWTVYVVSIQAIQVGLQQQQQRGSSNSPVFLWSVSEAAEWPTAVQRPHEQSSSSRGGGVSRPGIDLVYWMFTFYVHSWGDTVCFGALGMSATSLSYSLWLTVRLESQGITFVVFLFFLLMCLWCVFSFNLFWR